MEASGNSLKHSRNFVDIFFKDLSQFAAVKLDSVCRVYIVYNTGRGRDPFYMQIGHKYSIRNRGMNCLECISINIHIIENLYK